MRASKRWHKRDSKNNAQEIELATHIFVADSGCGYGFGILLEAKDKSRFEVFDSIENMERVARDMLKQMERHHLRLRGHDV